MQADSGRNLLIAWIALSAITLVSLWIGLRGAGDALAPDALLSGAAIVIMLIKVRVILRQFMEVGHAPVLLGRITDAWLLLTGCCLLIAVLAPALIAPASAQAPPEGPDHWWDGRPVVPVVEYGFAPGESAEVLGSFYAVRLEGKTGAGGSSN